MHSSSKRAALAREQEANAERSGRRSIVAAKLPSVHQLFGRATAWAQFVSLTRLRISNIVRDIPFWAIAHAHGRACSAITGITPAMWPIATSGRLPT